MSGQGTILKFTSEKGAAAVTTVVTALFEAMSAEETGGFTTFAAYRDPAAEGDYYLFVHYTDAGAQAHNQGPVVREAARALTGVMSGNLQRVVLAPVVVHGCGERIPGSPAHPERDESQDIGAVYSFRNKPEDDPEMERIMRALIEKMGVEEYPTGEVVTYTLFRNSAEPGQWYMFEHFTPKGAQIHAKGPLVRGHGHEHVALHTEPYVRVVLQPLFVKGCGEAIAA